MISVDEALGKIFDVVRPLPTERVPIRQAAGRVLSSVVTSRRDQPPFDASIMDGFAVGREDISAGDTFDIVGEVAAGTSFSGRVSEGEAVRIFTGAPIPAGAVRVIIQEDVSRSGDRITVSDTLDPSLYIRRRGADFSHDDRFDPRRRLTATDVALLAAMNIAEVDVYRRPQIAILATGDELVMPGEIPSQDQIVASNNLGLAAMIESVGAHARLLPIARDTHGSLAVALGLAAGADLLVTIGGASVGDYDLVGQVAADHGLDRAFHKVAMRPGKPLMAGRLGDMPMIGLPGNPVSAMVCGRIFVLPAIDVMVGLPARKAERRQVELAHDLPANGPREHYMRATIADGLISVAERQDSALLTVLASANALAVRPPNDAPRRAGQEIDAIALK